MRHLLFGLFIGICLCSQIVFAKENHLLNIKMVPLSDNRLRVDFCFEDILKDKPKNFMTRQPPRIILDFLQTRLNVPDNEKAQKVGLDALADYRAIGVKDRVRVILNLHSYSTYQGTITGRIYRLTLNGQSSQIFKPEPKLTITNQPVKTQYKLLGLRYKGIEKQGGRVIFDVNSGTVPVEVNRKGKEIIATFLGTQIPACLLKQYDVQDFHTPTQRIYTKQEGSKAIMTLKNAGEFGYFAYQIDKQFMIDVYPLTEDEIINQKLNKQVFLGKRISLNFQDIPVRSVLQLLGEFTKTNIVISDAVVGNITLRLDNVPWDQALNIILNARALGEIKDGNVVMIAPLSEIAAKEKQKYDLVQSSKDSLPMRSELIAINYASAKDLSDLIKSKDGSLLSKRGSVTVDARTNSLWIQDVESKLEEIRSFIKQLDVPVKQVLIESRIVEVTKNVSEDLGISFGFTHPNHVSGSLAGANQMLNNAQTTQATTPLAAAASVSPFTDRLNVDLPAQLTLGQAASIGIALAQLGDNVLLDLELSALESEGKGEVIASPRLITANQQEASILAGQEIPFQQATSSGATAVAFKQAALSLKVTPQITPDGRILMKLKINQDRPSDQLFNGVPAILTRQIDTNVLVKNGQTIVLGGIYQRTKANNLVRVPFFGTLPYVGALFRRTSVSQDDEELLIFITPKIITDSLSISAVEGTTVKERYK